MSETPLQMARRHVAEGQSRIDAQVIYVGEARHSRRDVEVAKKILQTMETSQALFLDDLARLEAQQK